MQLSDVGGLAILGAATVLLVMVVDMGFWPALRTRRVGRLQKPLLNRWLQFVGVRNKMPVERYISKENDYQNDLVHHLNVVGIESLQSVKVSSET